MSLALTFGRWSTRNGVHHSSTTITPFMSYLRWILQVYLYTPGLSKVKVHCSVIGTLRGLSIVGASSNSISNASFLCWYAGLEAPTMWETLARVIGNVEYGIPSLDSHDARFDPKRYWRGPVWGFMNMLIGSGMQEMLMPEGDHLRASTARLIQQHGFSEYFDPRDGSPAGGQSFTWTAAVWLGWASPNAGAK